MWWSEPVPVRLKANQTFNVGDPQKAAEILLYEWPGDPTGARHLAARRAVLKALENAHDGAARSRAREAFEAAASEAGILAPEPPKSGAPSGFRSPKWRKRKR